MACSFSVPHYQEILQEGLKQGYRFVDFKEITKIPAGKRACTVRHDLDYMPEWALRFAKIEKALGIRATYFFQVCARPYNLRETENYKTVHALAEMGHAVGLHFDLTWEENMEWEQVAENCEKDKAIFKAITGIEPCEIISFHNPHRFVDRILNQEIPGMSHTYEKTYFSTIKYISDSQGWYEGCMCNLFATQKYEKYQFLTHPYIWPEKSSGDFITDMANMLKTRSNELLEYMIKFHPVCKKNEARLRATLLEIQTKSISSPQSV